MKIPLRTRGHAGFDGDPMTPMIDVVFLLLVFFICASTGGTADQLLPAVLKGSDQSAVAQPVNAEPEEWQHPAIQIKLLRDANGLSVRMDDQVMAGLEELSLKLTQLAAVDRQSRVILNVHDDVAVQEFIAVYDLCQRLQFSSISFAVNTPR